jgi:hypothetical protein
MDENNDPNNPFISLHTPIALVALALSVLFFSQIKGVGTATETMRWQSDNADKQIFALKDNRERLARGIEERKPLVAQSEQTQKQFTDLMKDVDELARGGDKDAKTIIDGYGIKVNEPGGAPRASTDSKEPAKESK